jgi:hypothetical protein
MTRRPPGPGQLVLFGPVTIHLARRSEVTGATVCAACRVSLAVAGEWDRLDGCHDCPGLVVPAPPWALLTAVAEPGTGVELEEAA